MKKVGLLLLALVIALGGLGVGYAMWSDTIFVEGSVDTAEVCIEFFEFDDSDMCIGTEGLRPTIVPPATVVAGADPRLKEDGEKYWDKNVACTEIDWVRDEFGNIDYKTLEITVYNAYPGYYADWELEWRNCGTIPVRVQYAYLISDFPVATGTDWRDPEGDGPIWIDWVISGETLRGVQLHPGDEGSSSFKLLVMQTAEQLEVYKFYLHIEAVQWDEYDDTLPLIPEITGDVYTMPL